MEPENSQPPRRRPGRPRKAAAAAEMPKRKRGRPRGSVNKPKDPVAFTPDRQFDEYGSFSDIGGQSSQGDESSDCGTDASIATVSRRRSRRIQASDIQARLRRMVADESDASQASEGDEAPTTPRPRKRGRPVGPKNSDKGAGPAQGNVIFQVGSKENRDLLKWLPDNRYERQAYRDLNATFHRSVEASKEYYRTDALPVEKERYEAAGMPGCPDPTPRDNWSLEDEQRLKKRWDEGPETASLDSIDHGKDLAGLWKLSLRRFGLDPLTVLAKSRELEVDTSENGLMEHGSAQIHDPIWSQQFCRNLELIMAHPLWDGKYPWALMLFVIKWAVICRIDYRGPLRKHDKKLLWYSGTEIQDGWHEKSMGQQHKEYQDGLWAKGWWPPTESKLLTKILETASGNTRPVADTRTFRIKSSDLTVVIKALDNLNSPFGNFSCETHLQIRLAGGGGNNYPVGMGEFKELYKNSWLNIERIRACSPQESEGPFQMLESPEPRIPDAGLENEFRFGYDDPEDPFRSTSPEDETSQSPAEGDSRPRQDSSPAVDLLLGNNGTIGGSSPRQASAEGDNRPRQDSFPTLDQLLGNNGTTGGSSPRQASAEGNTHTGPSTFTFGQGMHCEFPKFESFGVHSGRPSTASHTKEADVTGDTEMVDALPPIFRETEWPSLNEVIDTAADPPTPPQTSRPKEAGDTEMVDGPPSLDDAIQPPADPSTLPQTNKAQSNSGMNTPLADASRQELPGTRSKDVGGNSTGAHTGTKPPKRPPGEDVGMPPSPKRTRRSPMAIRPSAKGPGAISQGPRTGRGLQKVADDDEFDKSSSESWEDGEIVDENGVEGWKELKGVGDVEP